MFFLARNKKHKRSAISLPAALRTVQPGAAAIPLPISREAARARPAAVGFAWFAHLAIAKIDAAKKAIVRPAAARLPNAAAAATHAAPPARQRAAAQAARQQAAAHAERADDEARAFFEQRWNYFAGEVNRVGVRAAARAVFSTASRSECALILASMPDAAPARRVRVNPNLEGAWSCSSSPAGASPTFEKRMSAHTHRPQPSAKR